MLNIIKKHDTIQAFANKNGINKNDKIRFFVEDSTGKKYIIKTDKKAINYIK